MDSFIQNSSEKFSVFLSQFDLKANSKISITYLIGFGIEVNSFDLNSNLDRLLKGFEKTFFICKPDEDRSILGFDDLTALNTEGKERFATIDKKASAFKANFHNNWNDLDIKDIPVFVGGAKFYSEQPNDTWGNFPDSYWFIPDNMLLKQNGKCYYIHYNLLTNKSDKEALIARYCSKLKKLSELCADGKFSEPRVVGVKGNTPKDKKRWIASTKDVIESLENGDLSKVVLSRSLELKISEELNLNYALDKLCRNNPSSSVFAYHSGKSTFLGASPEKLLKFEDFKIEIDALAGSAPRGKDEAEDLKFEQELLNSAKDLAEHKIVLDYITRSISKISDNVVFDPAPVVKKFSNIQHLSVPVKAELKHNASMFEVVELVFPTPAVCGMPKDKAMAIIKKTEEHRRGMYSGIVGWFNFSGQGEFSVAIRSAVTKGDKVTAFAGCGIVADSNAEKEYEESELKLKTILSLFENEIKSK